MREAERSEFNADFKNSINCREETLRKLFRLLSNKQLGFGERIVANRNTRNRRESDKQTNRQ